MNDDMDELTTLVVDAIDATKAITPDADESQNFVNAMRKVIPHLAAEVERLKAELAQIRRKEDPTPEICRCRASEGSDGDTYSGCVLDAGHDGECLSRARPDRVRAAAEAAKEK